MFGGRGSSGGLIRSEVQSLCRGDCGEDRICGGLHRDSMLDVSHLSVPLSVVSSERTTERGQEPNGQHDGEAQENVEEEDPGDALEKTRPKERFGLPRRKK